MGILDMMGVSESAVWHDSHEHVGIHECMLWGEGYLVIGCTGREIVHNNFALRVLHTRQDLLPTLGVFHTVARS